ncbi:molybdopterin-containing oxidoreductase family protein [Sinimarinibacterium flocculans]|uniref:Formate dehydrogenase n=1 Tax=Sinimarinibacterium flocculans TaxID=985250 RepID=A0A318EAD6_9GAMM|nr:molybdopterin-dependent oxidoreductase [Sinimarinibacterium flocculans]PXV69431.1 formate dehydrogenase [Sinimarinibacterium flocculans]
MSREIYTHCHYCASLCGVAVEVDDTGRDIVDIRPDRENPFSWGDFCRKGKAAAGMRNHPQRITTPMRRVGDRYVPATYEEAIADIAERMNRIIERHGADAVGSYHGNPLGHNFGDSNLHSGLLAAIGTGNRFWVGSLDQNSLHVVQEEMFGCELMSVPTDIDACECFLLIGMDPAVSKFGWIEVIPNGWNRVLAARDRGADLIVVDPRVTSTTREARTHVLVRPGEDWAFLLALIRIIVDEGWNRAPEAVPVNGLDEFFALVREADLDALSARCGVPIPQLRDVAERFAKANTAACVTHTGLAHSGTGTVGEWLSQLLNLITNRMDMPGGKRYERGFVDLPKAWAMMAPKSKHRSRLRDLPTVAGFHTVAEMADEILTPGPGQIRAMLICSGNPVVSGPDGDTLDRALSELDLLVAVDIVQRESHRHAHWLIPGTHWLEREGLHLAFGSIMDQPFAQYARRAVAPPEGVREEWRFFVDLALKMKRPLFGIRGVNAIVRASRALAKLLGLKKFEFGPAWFEWLMVTAGRRVKLRDIKARAHGHLYDRKRYGDLAKSLRTPSRKIECAPPALMDECRRLLSLPPPACDPDYPFVLLSRRNRESMNSWMNENAQLFQQHRGNQAELHADDMQALGLEDGDRVRVRSAVGEIELTVTTGNGGLPGIVTIPHGWGSRVFDARTPGRFSQWGTNRNRLVDNRAIDPLSQTPLLNMTRVRIERLDATADAGPDAGTQAASQGVSEGASRTVAAA